MSRAPFCYELPRERIAQRPAVPYDTAKLLVVHRETGALTDSSFRDLPESLEASDLLVLNDTRVRRARLLGNLSRTGGKVELLLLRELEDGLWSCLGKPRKKLTPGTELSFGEGVVATAEANDGPELLVRFSGTSRDALEGVGSMPIPPYIRGGVSDAQDDEDYQTLFAENAGSVAAPTASLHFTPELLERLATLGVSRERLTLHVGKASFLPVLQEDGTLTPPSSEQLFVAETVVAHIAQHRETGGRIIPVGTTAVRALESAARGTREGETDLFIEPGFSFRLTDGLITNFHQPGTTHLLLVEALLGRDLLEESYRYALEHDYRFLSYGDGMLIL